MPLGRFFGNDIRDNLRGFPMWTFFGQNFGVVLILLALALVRP